MDVVRPNSKVAAILSLLLSAACVPIPNGGEIEDIDMPFQEEAFLANGEGIVVLGGREDEFGQDYFTSCLREEFQSGNPPIRLIQSTDLQDRLFPWFELDTRPNNDEELLSLFGRSDVQDRIQQLNLRHILLVTGSTSEGQPAGVEAVIAGVHGSEQRTRVNAKIIDLKNTNVLGNAGVEAAATGGLAHVMLYGVILVPTTASTACEGLSRQLRAVFAGHEPPLLRSEPPSNQPRFATR